MTEERLRDKFVGAILGTMVGDALGAPVEEWPCDRLNGFLDTLPGLTEQEQEEYVSTFGLITGFPVPPGSARYTDDTEMTLGVAESLVAMRGLNEADMARRFATNLDGMRGYGAGAFGVLTAIKDGAPWYEPATQVFGGQGSYGNGAAMRVAPISLFYHNSSSDVVRDAAQRQSIITHTNLLGIEGAVMQALAVARATRFDLDEEDFDPDFFLTIIAANLRDDMDEYLEACDVVRVLLRQLPANYEVAETLECGIEAHLSVPAALYSFLAHYDSFAEAVLFAVRLGGDCDTIGAMTGAIAGAFHGASAIPPNWLEALENGPRGRDYARSVAEQLYEVWRETRQTAS